MQLVYRYRVKNVSASRFLTKLARDVNYVWNYCNSAQKHAVAWNTRWLTAYDLNNATSGSCDYLRIGAQTVQATCEQYATSRKAHKKRWLRFRGRKSLGWVPFKAAGIKAVEGGFRFMGRGFRVWLHRPLEGKIKCGSFAQDSQGNWFVNICCEVGLQPAAPASDVGVDLGLKTTASMSSGDKHDGYKFYRAVEPALAVAQRARKKRRTTKLHAKIKNRRKDALHKLSARLVSANHMVAVGNVNSAALAKTRMAKSVYDAGWGMLRTMLRYKAIRRAVLYVEVDEAYSSQICSTCGSLPASRPKGIAGLGIRRWECSDCGASHDRDTNAAVNIARLGRETLEVGSPRL